VISKTGPNRYSNVGVYSFVFFSSSLLTGQTESLNTEKGCTACAFEASCYRPQNIGEV
jgi:hypothetical protein